MAHLLNDKVAIVTGAGRGIGRGVARLMAEEGARVVVCDLGVNVDGSGADVSVADSVVAEIREGGGEAVACTENVASMEGGEKIVQTAIDSFGRLDIVVTVAGILRDRMVFNMSEQEWDDVIAVHLKGTFSVVKNAAVLFRQQRSGRIITFSSTSGLYGNSGQANYGAAKDGIAGFTRVVARDMGRYGVTANSISPSAATRMTTSVPDEARELRAARGHRHRRQHHPERRSGGHRAHGHLAGLRRSPARERAGVPRHRGASEPAEPTGTGQDHPEGRKVDRGGTGEGLPGHHRPGALQPPLPARCGSRVI